jgi:hypothetical protein
MGGETYFDWTPRYRVMQVLSNRNSTVAGASMSISQNPRNYTLYASKNNDGSVSYKNSSGWLQWFDVDGYKSCYLNTSPSYTDFVPFYLYIYGNHGSNDDGNLSGIRWNSYYSVGVIYDRES